MKRLISFAMFVICLLSLCSCNGMAEKSVFEDLEAVAAQYSLEDAKKAGYVVIENGDVAYGEDSWLEFVSQIEKGSPATIRVVHHYTLGDPSRYDPEYYESIRGDYPQIFFFELGFDGDKYREKHYEDGKLYEVEYKYLMRYKGEAETPYAKYSAYIRYVLVDDNTAAWEDITRGMVSSQFGDYIPHSQIYADLIYKEEP